jgi:hypothetical protein
MEFRRSDDWRLDQDELNSEESRQNKKSKSAHFETGQAARRTAQLI